MDKYLKSFNIAAYISGSGTNLKAILDNVLSGFLSSKVKLVISNNEEAVGLGFPRELGIDTLVIKRTGITRDEFSKIQLDSLQKHDIDLIVLAGYIKKITPKVVDKYRGKIINIHPALLPKFGGKGMYGKNVHEAVILAGESQSGPTVHFVDEIYDNGEIIHQKKIDIDIGNDTAETLAKKVLQLEYLAYSEAIKILEEERG